MSKFHICTKLEMRPHVRDEWGSNDTFEYCKECNQRWFVNRKKPYYEKVEIRNDFTNRYK